MVLFCVNMELLVVLTLQSELVDLAESIQQKLSYFNELENINTVGVYKVIIAYILSNNDFAK